VVGAGIVCGRVHPPSVELRGIKVLEGSCDVMRCDEIRMLLFIYCLVWLGVSVRVW